MKMAEGIAVNFSHEFLEKSGAHIPGWSLVFLPGAVRTAKVTPICELKINMEWCVRSRDKCRKLPVKALEHLHIK
jgi:hypothetical protein